MTVTTFRTFPARFAALDARQARRSFPWDIGWLMLLPSRGGLRGGRRGRWRHTFSGAGVVIRAARVATVVVGGDPASAAMHAKREWLAGLDGTPLAFRSAARPFMRVLGWRAWTMRGPADDAATAAAEAAAKDAGSMDAEGNVALRTLARPPPVQPSALLR